MTRLVRRKQIPPGTGMWYLYLQESRVVNGTRKTRSLGYLGAASKFVGSQAKQNLDRVERDHGAGTKDLVTKHLAQHDLRLRKSPRPTAASLREKDICELLSRSPAILGAGLRPYRARNQTEREVRLETKRVDIVLTDDDGSIVLVEVKVGGSHQEAFGQMTNYLLKWKKKTNRAVRGIIVTDKPDIDLVEHGR